MGFFLFLSILFHPAYSEFEEYREFPEYVEQFDTFLGESLIGSKEWKPYLLEKDPQLPAEKVDEKAKQVFARYARRGSAVIDYISKYGGDALELSKQVGAEGKVFALAKEPEKLRALFWNLLRAHVHNAKVYHASEPIENWNGETISMIRIDAHGREDQILNSAGAIIKRCRPVLLINMLGGLSMESTDPYLKHELDRRLEEIEGWGYTQQTLEGSWVLFTAS
jgi:hypothetical protein